MHTSTRTLRVPRPAAILAAAVLLLVAVLGAVRLGGPSSAATPAAAGCSYARQWYIGPNGEPYLLPWCGEAAGAASAVYPGRWLRGPRLDIGTATPTASTTSSTATPTSSTTSSTSAGSVGELAPVLSLDGVPAVVGTVASVDLTWTPAKAPGGSAVAFYVVQGRSSTETTWTQRGSSTTATHATVTGLARVEHAFRVQAVYSDGERGPWSNALAVAVPAAS